MPRLEFPLPEYAGKRPWRKWVCGYRGVKVVKIVVKISERTRTLSSAPLLLLAHVFADHLPEAAFSFFPELFIVRGLLADHASSATITGIEPHGGGRGAAIRAGESHSSPRLYERTAGPKLGGLFVLHAYQGSTLVILQRPNRTDGYLGPGRCLAYGMPVTRRKCNQAHQQDWRQYKRYKNSEGFLQVWTTPRINAADTLVEKSDSVNRHRFIGRLPMLSLLAQKPVQQG